MSDADGRSAQPSSRPAGEWVPPAPGSDWHVVDAGPEARYEGFAPPRPGRTPTAPGEGGGGAQPSSRSARAPEDPSLPVNGKAIASVVLAVCGFVVLPLLASVAAIVLGSLGRAEIAGKGVTRGARLANTGVVLGAAGIVFQIALVAWFAGWPK